MRRKHILLPAELVRPEPYTSPSAGGGGAPGPLPLRDRTAHAQRLLAGLASISKFAGLAKLERANRGIDRPGGVYVQFDGASGFDLPAESLAREQSGIVLLNTRESPQGDRAVVFVPSDKIKQVESIITRFRDEDRNGKPKNQKLVATMEAVALAHVDALWTDEFEVLPDDPGEKFWAELWLRNDAQSEPLDEVRNLLSSVGLEVGRGRANFPERTVIPVRGNRVEFGEAMLLVNSIAELRRAKEAADFFTKESASSQQAWIDSLAQRIAGTAEVAAPRVCVLDTGLNNHPLLLPVMARSGTHSVEPGWGATDSDGHGTNMAGLAMFGDLADALLTSGPFPVQHKLESVKLLTRSGANSGWLFGDLTREGVSRAEIAAPDVDRAFVMALSAKDARDRGRPSTWSAMIDALASGADDDVRRLFILCCGNVSREHWVNYPASNATEGIHDPGQAWNAITVGAYTDKEFIDESVFPGWAPLVPAGDLGPSSSTSATWGKWPIKPDVVFEGGNAGKDPAGSIDTVATLDLLTTNHQFVARPLQLFGDTSAATALAGRFAAQLYAARPRLWPETIRGLMVHSAQWRDAMLARFVSGDAWSATKGEVRNLLRHCGYGVPNLDAAIWSLENDLTLVYQGELQPYEAKLNDEGRQEGIKTKEMNLHELPWPREELEALGSTEVELRVTLSYFIEPNPAERGWAGRYRYQSHGLRFAVKKGSETVRQFRHRVNAFARASEGGEGGTDSDGWLIGSDTRSLGSIHSDRWRGTAQELAERGVIAVCPTIGWWKERPKHSRIDRAARYSLIVSIHAPDVDVDLFTSVENQINVSVAVDGT